MHAAKSRRWTNVVMTAIGEDQMDMDGWIWMAGKTLARAWGSGFWALVLGSVLRDAVGVGRAILQRPEPFPTPVNSNRCPASPAMALAQAPKIRTSIAP